MSAELKRNPHLEIGHILFIDVVGYSRLLVNEQRAVVEELNQIVRSTNEFRAAEAEKKLVRLPAGDGMALVFFDSPEAPVQCALEISKALQNRPEIRLRMGINSGPIDALTDVNDRSNVAGAGINMAQRVMDCGDAGHILLSKRVAEDLAQYNKWQPHLHELGECEVKHGVKVTLVNLWSDGIGNPALPEKLKRMRESEARKIAGRRRIAASAAFLLAVLVIAGWWIFREQTRRRATAASSFPHKSIAVLPFENLSDDKQDAYFADGVQDEILNCLAKVADLRVISRTSVMQYKSDTKRNLPEIAKELGVVHLLEGRVQRAANRVRVSAKLIDARTDAHVWGQSYDRDLADVFAIQSEIAQAIADQLEAKISPTEKVAIEKPPTTDLAAYDLYLRARELYAHSTDFIHGRENLPKVVELLNNAVARDARFSLAWCLLSRVHGFTYFQGLDRKLARLDLASAAVQAALRFEPDSGEAHLALANYYYHGFRDYGRARAELATARRTLPNSAEVFEYTGYIDRREGRWEEGTRNLERALELDPRNFFTLLQLALFYHAQRRYVEELRTYDRALRIVPGDPATRIYRALVALHWQADIKPFQTTFATVVEEDPKIAPTADGPSYGLCERTDAAAARVLKNYPREGGSLFGVMYPRAYWEGVVARWQGNQPKARAAFTVARTEVAAAVAKEPDFAAALSLLGLIDAGLGRKEEAIREGRRACELLPISKDAVDGVAIAVNLAQIYAWTGEKDLALEQLAATLRIPNDYATYGHLRLHPLWDPLRGDPRFEKLVASLAPK